MEAIEWTVGKRAENIISLREKTMRAIKKFALELARDGERERWWTFTSIPLQKLLLALHARRAEMPDATIGHVCKGVNGPLMLALAKSCGYEDLDVVNLFRDGPLAGATGQVIAVCLHNRFEH